MNIEKKETPLRLVYAALFAVSSMIFVNQGADFYFKHIDKTEYFTVKQPVTVDKHEYLAGESILVDLVRTSMVTSRAVSTVELILVNAEGEWYKETIGGGEFNIDKSNGQVIHITFRLPPDIPVGQYFLKAVVNYEFRHIPKNYVWESESFSVVNPPAQENGQIE